MEAINYKCKELRRSVKTLKTLPEPRLCGEKYHPHLFPDSRPPQRASCRARSVTSDLICGLKRGFPCREFKLSKIMISRIIMGFVRLFSPLPLLPPHYEDAAMSPGVSPTLVRTPPGRCRLRPQGLPCFASLQIHR